MKPQTSLYLLLVLLAIALGGVWLFDALDDKGPAQIFPATINRDCAPWDGAAFTVSVPLKDGTTINISIWNTPDIKFPVAFSFPDDTGQIGNALLIHQTGLSDPLTGNVFFSRVDQGHPVEGNFELMDENAKQFKGKIKAEWENRMILCG